MDPARVSTPVTFKDGLGDRHSTDGPSGEPLEVFTLRKDLTAVPAFEFALRERVSRLAGFSHESFGPVRGISRLGTDASTLALVSDRIRGDRLSTILALADRELIPLEYGAALALIRQLVDAMAALHDTVRDVCHGAIAPERVVITPDARVVLVEHVLGGALSSLQYSRDRYWKELRVALPPTAGAPHFDRRADVTQVGAIALALITGRPLADNHYPDRVNEIVSRVGAVSASGGLEPLPDLFRGWLSRALQLDPRQSFGSAIDARDELHRVLAETGAVASPEKLHAFLAQCRDSAAPSSPAKPTPIAFPAASRIPAVKRPASSPSNSRPVSSPSISRPVSPVSTSLQQPLRRTAEAAPDQRRALPVPHVTSRSLARRPRRRFVAAALFAAVASMATLTAGTFLVSAEPPPAGAGRLLVNSDPTGALVKIDGHVRGKTPLALAVLPGEHRIEVVGDTRRRSEPVFVMPNETVAQFVRLSGAAADAEGESASAEADPAPVEEPARVEAGDTVAPVTPPTAAETKAEAASHTGWISVAAPVDLRVYLNRKLLGSSRTSRIVSPVGRHEIQIVSESLGYKVTRTVTVSAGKVSPVTLDWPKGSLSVNALPWAEVTVDGERIGETPIGDVALPIGPHEVVFRHPELGEQRHRVIVTTSNPARLSVDMRKK